MYKKEKKTVDKLIKKHIIMDKETEMLLQINLKTKYWDINKQ